MKLFILSLLLFFTVYHCTSQVINSSEQEIADFYDATSTRLKLTGNKLAIEFRIDTDTTYYKKISANERTAEKIKSKVIELTTSNSSALFDLDKFDFEKVGFSGGFAFVNSFSKIYTNSDYSNIIRSGFLKGLFTTRIGAEIGYDRFNNFDPEKNKIDNEKPIELAIKWNANYYLFTNKKGWQGYHLIPSWNAKVNLIGYNSLSNYVLNDNITSTNNQVTVTSAKSFDGKFGTIDNDVKSVISNVSMSLISNNSGWTKYIVGIPYGGFLVKDDEKPIFTGGFALGFLGESILGSESTEDADVNGDGTKTTHYFKKFVSPSILSIGVDWSTQGGISSKPNYLISGTFKF